MTLRMTYGLVVKRNKYLVSQRISSVNPVSKLMIKSSQVKAHYHHYSQHQKRKERLEPCSRLFMK